MSFFPFLKSNVQKKFLNELESVLASLNDKLTREEVSLEEVNAKQTLHKLRGVIVKHIKGDNFTKEYKDNRAKPDHLVLAWMFSLLSDEIDDLDISSYTATQRQSLARLYKIMITEADSRGVHLEFEPERMIEENRKRLFG